jgi:hypothetical protein
MTGRFFILQTPGLQVTIVVLGNLRFEKLRGQLAGGALAADSENSGQVG